MNESKFWEKIRDNIRLDMLKRVENILEPGWADVFYMHDTYPGWIELKAEAKFPRRIEFERAQPIWLEEYWRKGGTCWVWLYVWEANQIWVWQGKDARQLDTDARSVEPAVQVVANRKGWDALYDLLVKNHSRRRS